MEIKNMSINSNFKQTNKTKLTAALFFGLMVFATGIHPTKSNGGIKGGYNLCFL
jgi:hypothetical protein